MVCGMGGCGGFFFFFFFFFHSAIVCGCGGSGWRWRCWVDVVVGDAGLRKRETEERETKRGRIKNDKERIFK